MAGVSFAGKWKTDRAENKEAFLTAIGVGPEKVKHFASLKQTIDIAHTGDDFCGKQFNEDGTLIMENIFKVGVSFTPKVPEGIPQQGEHDTSWEEGGTVLRLTTKVGEKTLTSDMKLENGELVYTQSLGDITATEYFKKN